MSNLYLQTNPFSSTSEPTIGVNSYISLAEADNYFTVHRLHSDYWIDSSDELHKLALINASQYCSSLDIKGWYEYRLTLNADTEDVNAFDSVDLRMWKAGVCEMAIGLLSRDRINDKAPIKSVDRDGIKIEMEAFNEHIMSDRAKELIGPYLRERTIRR